MNDSLENTKGKHAGRHRSLRIRNEHYQMAYVEKFSDECKSEVDHGTVSQIKRTSSAKRNKGARGKE